MTSKLCNVGRVKARLGVLREKNRVESLELESPLLWDIPPFFKDEMQRGELERVIQAKTSEINPYGVEKVLVFLLDALIQCLKGSVGKNASEYTRIYQVIETIKDIPLKREDLANFREDLAFLVSSTRLIVELLEQERSYTSSSPPAHTSTLRGNNPFTAHTASSSTNSFSSLANPSPSNSFTSLAGPSSTSPSPLPEPSPSRETTVAGVKGWYNMVLYNYSTALVHFESIATTPQYRPLFAFYHGKTIARARREMNVWTVTGLVSLKYNE